MYVYVLLVEVHSTGGGEEMRRTPCTSSNTAEAVLMGCLGRSRSRKSVPMLPSTCTSRTPRKYLRSFLSSSINPSLQAQRVEQLALVQPPKNLGKAVQILVCPDSDTIAFLEGTTQQRDSHVADLAEL